MAAYINGYRQRIREKMQNQSLIAYYQAGLIATLFSGKKGDVPCVWDVFPFWTEEETEELDQQRMISELKKTLLSMNTGRKEGD